MLSSLYFGLFLSAYLVVVGGAIALALRGASSRLKPLLAGAAVAAVMTAPLAWPYLQVRQAQGERTYAEMAVFSARPQQYLVAHSTRTTYYSVLPGPHEGERELFPGILVVALAMVAVWPPLSASRIAYTLGLLFAFDASLGMHGSIFPALAQHVLPFRGLRVPARFSMLVGLSLAILAGFGTARLGARVPRRWLKYAFGATLVAIVLFESRVTLSFKDVPAPHPIYRWFEGRPAGVIAELPPLAGEADGLAADVHYLYPATFHWQRMLNGNSGYFPMSHLRFCATMRTFPDDRAISLLQRRGVDYVVIHEEYYGQPKYGEIVAAIEQRGEFREVARGSDKAFEARIYRLLR
jgi:hypothetical protein